MFRAWPLFFVIFTILFVSVTHASEIDSFIEKANTMHLSDDPFWQDLLHFKGGRSLILDRDFFLSERGQTDPRAELEATIEAYFTQKHAIKRESGDTNIVCIFPARYAWLNEKLDLPNYRCDESLCPALHRWARLDQIEDISLIYVSAYLGNPASSFGHALLNLKTKDSDKLFGLFDTTIAFGATVPANENMVIYVLNGLFGGYRATYSDKFFYFHDQAITHREFRDMWEYTLQLTDFQKRMLIYHLAELLTKRFRYYFLNRNCAQGVAALLDIFIEENIYNFNYPIYVPEELFHRLQRIDVKRRENKKVGLIKNIRYIPSARRYLFYEIKRLSSEERRAYLSITNSPDEDFALVLKKLDITSRINVLNALLAYQYYKLMASYEQNQHLKEYKDRILLERLRLPVKKEIPLSISEIPPPTDVSPPSTFSVGFVQEKGGDAFSTLGVTVFRKESVGMNALEYGECVALDLNIGIAFNSGKAFVDTFNFLKIRDFRTFYIKEEKESPLSWRFRAGVDRHNINRNVSYDYVLDGGIGLVKKVSNIGILYGFMNASYHSLDPQHRVGPSVGLVAGHDFLKFQMDYGLEFGFKNYNYSEIVKTKLQYQINQQNAIQISFEKNARERLSLSYFFFW